MLTPRQADLLSYINTFINLNGYSPTFEEMMFGVDITSKSGIHRLLTALEARGFIRRLHGKQRAIEVLRPDVGSMHLVNYSDNEILEEAIRRKLILFSPA